MAVNCWVSPFAIDGLGGFREIETKVAGVTDSVVVPLIVPDAALIVLCPVATLVASPPRLTVATPGTEELHVAAVVRSCMVPSLNVPVAENC